MKILIFTYSITRKAGGVFNAVCDLFTNKAFTGEEIKIFSYKDENVLKDLPSWKGLPIQLFKAGPMLYSKEVKKKLLQETADIFHMEALWRYPHILMGIWKKHYKIPIVCSPHGMLDPYIIKKQGKIKRIIANIFFSIGLIAVYCYHALCQKEMEDIRAYGLKQPIAIIPNGINLPKTTKKYVKPDSNYHLLYLGRLHPKKGIDILLQAIATLKKENPNIFNNWIIDIVGWDHENCQTKLEHIVHSNNLKEIVIFHGGLFGEDKIKMYANADAYILPSHGEGLPMTILEAWSWKLPVVMTPQCNIPEGFEANAAIRIEDNVSSIKQGLQTLFNMSDEERISMGNRGYKLVSENFTWDASAQKMIMLYKWLTNQGEKPDFVYE